MAEIQYYGTGRRKTAVARVYLRPGSGNVVVNHRDFDEFFPNQVLKMIIRQPLLLTETADKFDILVHSVGFAPREQLAGGFIESITREGYAISHDISAYSLAALAKAALPMMEGRDGAMLTLSYLGSERVLKGYNVMGLAKASLEANVRYMARSLGPKGIRVNAISAGPIKTLAAAGIAQFRKMLHHVEETTPLRRTITPKEVGNVAAFLCSDLASGVTGEITFVDSGYNILGMSGLD